MTRLAGDRCEARETCHLFAIKRADLWQKCQYGCRCDRADPGHRAQNVTAACGGLLCLNQRLDLGVQLDNLTVYLGKPCLGLTFQYRDILNLEAVS